MLFVFRTSAFWLWIAVAWVWALTPMLARAQPGVAAVSPPAGTTLGASAFFLDVTFSEPVLGVDASDLVLSGTASAGATVGSPSDIGGNTWRFLLEGVGNGTLVATLAPDPGDIQNGSGQDLSPRPVVWSYPSSIFAEVFADEFEALTFDPARWALADGATLEAVAAGIANSVRLNGSPDGSDELRSGALDLAAADRALVFYRSMCGGPGNRPETSDALFLEFLNASGTWVQADMRPGGVTETAFVERFVELPFAAFHPLFQIRLRNVATVGNTDDWFVDNIRLLASTADPRVASVFPPASATITTPTAEVNIVFSKPVLGVDASDLVLAGPGAAGVILGAPLAIAPNHWRFPVSGLVDGAVQLTLAPDAGDIVDAVGRNLDSAPIVWSYTVADADPLIVAIAPASGANLTESSAELRVTFSEPVFGVDASDLVLSGNAAAGAAVGAPADLGGNIWSFAITGLANGSVGVALAPDPGDIVDSAGNNLSAASAQWTWLVTLFTELFADTFPTTTFDPVKWATIEGPVSIQPKSGAPSPPNAVRFRSVTSAAELLKSVPLDLSDTGQVLLRFATQYSSGGSAPFPPNMTVGFTDSGGALIPLGLIWNNTAGSIAFEDRLFYLPEAARHPAAQIYFQVPASSGAINFDRFIDDVRLEATNGPPRVALIGPAPGSTALHVFDLYISFTRKVLGVDSTDLVLTGSAAASAVIGAAEDAGNYVWKFPISGLQDGTLNLQLAPDPNDIVDVHGRGLDPKPTPWSYSVFDLQPFMVSLFPPAGRVFDRPWQTFTARFSEPVFGVDATDFVLSGSGSQLAFVSAVRQDNDYEWEFDVTDMRDGEVIVTLAPDSFDIVDSSGQDMSPRPAPSSYTVADPPPSLTTFFPPDGSAHATPEMYVELTFSEGIFGLDAADLALSGAAAASAVVGSGQSVGTNKFRFPITGLAEGPLSVSVGDAPGGITDAAGKDLAVRPIIADYDVAHRATMFIDTFTSQSLDRTKWIDTAVISVVNLGEDAHSPPYAARLSSSASSMISKDIPFVSQPQAFVRYFYRRPSAGPNLILEYRNGSGPGTGPYIELDQLTAGGAGEPGFSMRLIQLPAAAWHPNFHIRLRGSAGSGAGTWYVDDIAVEAGLVPPAVNAVAPLAGATITTRAANIDVTFSEAVSGIDASDLVLSGPGAAGAVVGAPQSRPNNQWRFPVDGLIDGQLNVTLAGDPGDVVDATSLDLEPGPTAWSYVVLDTPPRVLSAAPAAGTFVTPPFNFDVSFSEPVFGVDASDIDFSLPGMSVGSVSNTSGNTWRFVVNGAFEGPLLLTVAPDPGDIVDSAGKNLDPGPFTREVEYPRMSVVFFDPFPEPYFDTAKWSRLHWVTIDELGIAEPSQPYSARLIYTTARLHQLDSQTVDVSGSTEAVLSYTYQRTGGGGSPEPSENLTLSYSTNGTNWFDLLGHAGSGPDMTTFEPAVHFLLVGQRNSPFKFRFEAEVSGADEPDDWFIDDVTLRARFFGPKVAMTSSAPDPAGVSPIPVTVAFTAAVTGFTAADLIVKNASVSNFAGSGASYTFNLTPFAPARVSVEILAGAAKNAAAQGCQGARFTRDYTDGPSAPSGQILGYLLGQTTNSAGLDVNADGAVDAADLAQNIARHHPAAPNTPDPHDGSTTATLATALKWGSIPRASSYDVFIWPSAEPMPSAPRAAGLQARFLDLPGYLQNGTEYFWKVIARNASGETAGPVWRFATLPLPPDPPTLPVQPADGATGVSGLGMLSWVPVPRATSYDLYLWASTDPAPVVPTVAGLPASAVFVPFPLLPGSLYFWRVDAHNVSGSAVGPSWSFTMAPIQ